MFTKMSWNPESQKKLENFKMENPVELARAFKDKQIEWFKDLKILETDVDINNTVADIDNTAKEAINLLDKEKLISFIEQSLKVEGESGKEWLTYSEMRQNPFFPFMVQSSIDLLSDELMNDDIEIKYDENWNEDEKWKTLDEYIGLYWWIDNIYWSWTWKTVKMVQNILWLEPADGFAWPQFFEKVCSFLKWEDVDVSNFKVHWYDEENKYPYGFEKTVTNDPEWRTKTDEKIDDNYTKYTITDLWNLVNKEKFPENSCVVYENDDVNYIFYNDGKVKDVKDNKTWDWSINEWKVEVKRNWEENNTIIYKKAIEEKVDENVVEEINNNESNDVETLWDWLYNIYMPEWVSIEKDTDFSYKIIYKNVVLWKITLQVTQLAKYKIYEFWNLTCNIDNSKRPGDIILEFNNKNSINYYEREFILDHWLSAKIESGLLKFYDASWNYTNRYIGYNENGIVCNKDDDNNLYALPESSGDWWKDIEITKDPSGNKYYLYRKEDVEL